MNPVECIWWVNGRHVGVDPGDRGLAYGDGLFETMACRGGRIRWIEHHLDRLTYGCGRLSIPLPSREALHAEIQARCPASGLAVVKLIVTRGSGARGYAPPEPAVSTRILSIGPWSAPPEAHYTDGVRVRTCALRLGENPQLAGLKHLCRLEQVLAQMELTGSTAQEGLLRNASGLVVGGIASNVFGVREGVLLTPKLTRCGVHGVMRRVVLEHAREVDLEPCERDIDVTVLLGCEELFLTNALYGIKPVRALDEHGFAAGRKTRELMQLLDIGAHA